jgi:hypothetical protein
LVAIGKAWICFLPVHGSCRLHVLPGLLIMPIGYDMSFPPMCAAATAGVPRHFAGLASGLITTCQQMGGAIGLVILSGVAATLTSSLTHDTTAQALTSGYNRGMAVSVIFTLISVFAAILVIHTPKLVPAEPSPATGNRSLVPFDHAHPRNSRVGSLAVPPSGDADSSSCACANMPHLTIPYCEMGRASAVNVR